MTAVLSRALAEKLFATGELSPVDDAETYRIKYERRMRARIRRYVPTQLSETACMSSGRKSHFPYRDAHAIPGPCATLVTCGHVVIGGRTIETAILVSDVARRFKL